MRVCLDTNVLVAAFATRGLCADVLRTVLNEHELVLGEVIMTELRLVLTEALGLTEDRIAVVEAVFAAIDLVTRPDHPSDIAVRDPDDRWVLATAVSGRADVLVTGDRDLLDVASESPLPILTPRAFWNLLRKPAED